MIIKSFGIAALVALGWLTVLAVVMRVSDDAPAALVLFPNANFIHNLPQDGAITGRSRLSITVSSNENALTQRLYQAGAVLVLPAGLAGCLGIAG